MANFIDQTFGTPRGAVRLALSYAQVALGQSHARKPRDGEVRRLVFVCHGNICRSAYAEELAARAGFETASFGLSTSTGNPAHPPIVEEAAARGIDLSAHAATNVDAFAPQPGDYLLGMEVRHLARLAADPRLSVHPRGLLGSYASPAFPHLHDPYKITPEYLPVCLDRIESAVEGLVRRFSAGAAGARSPQDPRETV
jgi:protein-tyrosine phosphatase